MGSLLPYSRFLWSLLQKNTSSHKQTSLECLWQVVCQCTIHQVRSFSTRMPNIVSSVRCLWNQVSVRPSWSQSPCVGRGTHTQGRPTFCSRPKPLLSRDQWRQQIVLFLFVFGGPQHTYAYYAFINIRVHFCKKGLLVKTLILCCANTVANIV